MSPKVPFQPVGAGAHRLVRVCHGADVRQPGAGLAVLDAMTAALYATSGTTPATHVAQCGSEYQLYEETVTFVVVLVARVGAA